MHQRNLMIDRLYHILHLAQSRKPSTSSSILYFQFEDGEQRAGGQAPRVTRVGISETAGAARPATLATQSSIFASYVFTALALRDDLQRKLRGQLGDPKLDVNRYLNKNFTLMPKDRGFRDAMRRYEDNVVRPYITAHFRYTWIAVPDVLFLHEAETKAVALLSNFNGAAIDPHSPQWLGRFSDKDKIRRSGLWNAHYVAYPVPGNSAWLDQLEKLV